MEPTMNTRSDPADTRNPAHGLNPLDIDALVEARHPDAFSMLGLHETDLGHVVRVFLQGAASVSVADAGNGEHLGSLARIHDAGLYAGFVARPAAYRLKIDWPRIRRLTGRGVIELWERMLPGLAASG